MTHDLIPTESKIFTSKELYYRSIGNVYKIDFGFILTLQCKEALILPEGSLFHSKPPASLVHCRL